MNERLRSLLHASLGQHSSATGKSRASVPGTRKPAGGKSSPADAKQSARLVASAQNLFKRALKHATLELPDTRIDGDSLETACLALLLPFCTGEPMKQTSMGVMSITERCSQSAELLVSIAVPTLPEDLIDRATRILAECPRKGTTLPEAQVLSDAINIEDFGLSGLCRSAALLVLPGGDLAQLADAFQKREQYGYWDARIKDGFHFESTRKVARARLKAAREGIRQLQAELAEDVP